MARNGESVVEKNNLTYNEKLDVIIEALAELTEKVDELTEQNSELAEKIANLTASGDGFSVDDGFDS